MKILAFVHDRYGRRIAENIRSRAPASWALDQLIAPRVLPPIVDQPLEFLPPDVAPADLILSLVESARAAQLLPGLVQRTGARLVIAPVDNESWLPAGLRRQLVQELEALGARIHYPQPFCSLEPTQVPVNEAGPDALLAEFSRHFGRPSLRISLEEDQDTIREVRVLRGAPCGSSQYAATRIAGMRLADVIPQGGLICLHYPCLASMQPKTTEHGVETLMHTSGIIYNQSLQEALDRLDPESD